MERTSLMYRAREERDHRRRINAALDAWDKVKTDDRDMPVEFQELFECTLLSPKELEEAKTRKIYLLESRIAECEDRAFHMSRELRELRFPPAAQKPMIPPPDFSWDDRDN